MNDVLCLQEEEERRLKETSATTEPRHAYVTRRLHASSDDVSDESGFFVPAHSTSKQPHPIATNSTWTPQAVNGDGQTDLLYKPVCDGATFKTSSTFPLQSGPDLTDTTLDDQGYGSQLNSPSKNIEPSVTSVVEHAQEVVETPIVESVAPRRKTQEAAHALARRKSSKKSSPRSRRTDVTVLRKSESLVNRSCSDVTPAARRPRRSSAAAEVLRTRDVRKRADQLLRMYQAKTSREATATVKNDVIQTTYVTTLEREVVQPCMHSVSLCVESYSQLDRATLSTHNADVIIPRVDVGKPVNILFHDSSHARYLTHKTQAVTYDSLLSQETYDSLDASRNQTAVSFSTEGHNVQSLRLINREFTSDSVINKSAMRASEQVFAAGDKSAVREQVPVTNIDDVEVCDSEKDLKSCDSLEAIRDYPKINLIKSPHQDRSSIKCNRHALPYSISTSSREESMKLNSDQDATLVSQHTQPEMRPEDDNQSVTSDALSGNESIFVKGLNTQEFEDLLNLQETPADVTHAQQISGNIKVAGGDTAYVSNASVFNAEVSIFKPKKEGIL